MASTTTVEPGRAGVGAETAPRTSRRRGIPWSSVRSYVGIVAIVLMTVLAAGVQRLAGRRFLLE